MPRELTEKQAYLALNALPGIGPIGLNQLLGAFGGCLLYTSRCV